MDSLHELIRPWKLATLAVGVALLIVGAFYYQALDWDIGVSLTMAALADSDALSFSEATAGSAPEKACRHPRGCWFHAGAPAVGRDG